MKKVNYFKYATTVLLLVLILMLSFNLVRQNKQLHLIKFDISQKDFNNLLNSADKYSLPFGNQESGEFYVLCSIKEGYCQDVGAIN